ncbi:MAG TPA: carbohydrate ABC transporter permease [Caldilineae bacterium]|nr:carbohydrate ABC transporter permease [Caldilineae bacterium]
MRGTMILARPRVSFGQALAYVVLAVGGVLMLTPFFWLVSSSLKRPETIYIFPPQWIPRPAYWSNYIEVFSAVPVLLYARNTLVITLSATAGAVITSAFAGYSFARLRFRGRDAVFSIILSTLMLPYAVTMIPIYVMFSKLGWVGTFLPLIVPAWFGGGAFNIFLLRQFFRTIPRELEDAARIDGASRWRVFFQIAVPLARPALIVVTIQTFLAQWNGFLQPLIYLNKRSLWTLALGVNGLKEFESGLDWTHYMMVLSTMMVVPVVIIYFLAQRAFIQGIVMTGLKG